MRYPDLTCRAMLRSDGLTVLSLGLLLMFSMCLAAQASPWTWDRVSDNPTPRRMLGSTYMDGRVYLVTGETASHYGYSTDLLSYDPIMDQWQTLASAPTARSYNAVVPFEGRVWSIGGNNGEPMRTVESYDPGTNSWRTETSLLDARYASGAAVAAGKIYVAGSPSMEIYDPSAGSWTYGPSPSYGSLAAGSSVSMDDRFIYHLNYAGTRAGELDIFDTATNSWTLGPVIDSPLLNTAGFGLHLFALGDEVYALSDTPNTGEDPYLFWLNDGLDQWDELGQVTELAGKGVYAAVPIDLDSVFVTAGEYRPTQPSVDPASWIGTVPEPATLVLLALGAVAALKRQKRHQ